MNGFEKLSKLGEGAYSTVLKVRRYADGNIYALKKVKLTKLSEKEKLNALNEVRILASVKSNFVISYKEAFFDERESCLGIVMEYADKGDLYQKITEYKKTAMLFDEIDIWRILIQCIKGLKSLHDLKILHRDMKSANVFLFSDGSAKLGDLNVSKVARKGLGYTQTGTPYYASPEVWKDQPYDNKSDIWSLGCVLYEMITLHPPFRAENMEGLYNKVIRGQYKKIPSRFSADLAEIVSLLIQVDSNTRPSCDELLNNPIIRKRIEYFKAFAGDEVNEDMALLKTINIPKNLLFLTDKLPQPNYDKKKNNNTNNSLKTSANTITLTTQKQLISLNLNNSDNSKNLSKNFINNIKNKNDIMEKKIELKKIELSNNIKPPNINLISEKNKEDNNIKDEVLNKNSKDENLKKENSLIKEEKINNEEKHLKKESNNLINKKILLDIKKEKKIEEEKIEKEEKQNLEKEEKEKLKEKIEKEKIEKLKKIEKEKIEREKLEKEKIEKEKLEKEKLEKEKLEKEKLEKEEFERKIQEQKLLKEKLIKEQEENERKEREFKEKLKIEKARIEKEEKLRLENEEKHKQKFLMELKMKKELLKQQLIDKDSKKYLNYISRSIDGTNNYNKNLRLDNSPSLEKNSFIYKSKFQTKKLKLPNLKNSFELPLINRINLGVYNNKINLINNFDSVVHNNNNLRYKLSSNNSNNQIYKISVQKPPIRFQPFNYDKRLINNNYGYRNNLNLYNNYNGYKLNKDVYINQNLKKKLIPIKKIY
jgi:NIMA (never in mitosis gene a)-related kinase